MKFKTTYCRNGCVYGKGKELRVKGICCFFVLGVVGVYQIPLHVICIWSLVDVKVPHVLYICCLEANLFAGNEVDLGRYW